MAGWLQLALTVSGSANADALNFDEIGPILQSAAGDQGYVSSILMKLGMARRTEAAVFAVRAAENR